MQRLQRMKSLENTEHYDEMKKGIKKGMKKCKCKPHQEVKTKDDIKFSSLSFQWKMPSLDDAFIAVGQHVLHLHLFTSRVLLFLSTHFP